MTRAEKVAEAQRLRAEGLKRREIAERMGVAPGTVSSWFDDPDLSKHRRRREGYRGTCVDCGASTDGSNGHGHASERCRKCDAKLAGPRSRERHREQRELVERLWAEGKSTREIGERLGWSGQYLKCGIVILRSRGYDLPVRNRAAAAAASSPEGRARIEKARLASLENRRGAAA